MEVGGLSKKSKQTVSETILLKLKTAKAKMPPPHCCTMVVTGEAASSSSKAARMHVLEDWSTSSTYFVWVEVCDFLVAPKLFSFNGAIPKFKIGLNAKL
jgi:hypothetical protein